MGLPSHFFGFPSSPVPVQVVQLVPSLLPVPRQFGQGRVLVFVGSIWGYEGGVQIVYRNPTANRFGQILD